MLRLEWTSLNLPVLVALALSGCGGGGGGDNQPPPPPPPATFTVGGAVTGLSGSVVLRLNGGNDLTVNSAGAFAFPTALANGASYTVTIASQPAKQVCGPGVANGTGSISAANVTNVAITCANYSVGGTVTGLNGSGLVLQVNGGNDLDVPAAASSFTFPASLALGGILYSVHIKTQPAGQTCTIVDSSGAVTAGAPTVNSAAVACIDNVTDALSGTYRAQSQNGQPIADFRAFLTFYPDGTYIFGLHQDDPECGPSGHGGVEYGIYRWNRAAHTIEIRNAVIDTNGECGISSGAAISETLIVNADGTLTFIDAAHADDTFVVAPITSTADTLIGSWGDNQAFIAYDSNGKYFLAMTRSIVQNAAASPGIEDGCYALSGTTASGSFTTNVSATCAVSAAQTAADTTGPIGLSGFASAVDFVVTGNAMQVTVGGVNVLPFVPGTRIASVTPPTSTFTVGGSITNLAGTGLQLQLNGETGQTFNVNPAVGANSFTFGAQLQAGTPYRVTVVAAPATPSQSCFFASPPIGTIATSHVTNIAINCFNSAPYKASGNVSGLTGAGLTLRMLRTDISIAGGATVSEDLPVAANGAFEFSIPAGSTFDIGILSQPTGQTCTVTRALGFSLVNNFTGLTVNCVNNATGPLSGTYSFLDDHGRGYLHFNADGTFTTALIHSRPPTDPDPNAGDCGDTRKGNGVEYGVFTWNQATHAFALAAAPAVDTNGECGLADANDFAASFSGFISRVGNTIEVRELAADPDPIVTAAAVESTPGTLVGAWVAEANNGELLVFHADGTFLWAETQEYGLFPLDYGQERGCYSVSGSSLTLTIDATNCHPDGFDPYDLNNSHINGTGGFFRAGVTASGPLPFAFEDAETLSFFGRTFKRTHPN